MPRTKYDDMTDDQLLDELGIVRRDSIEREQIIDVLKNRHPHDWADVVTRGNEKKDANTQIAAKATKANEVGNTLGAAKEADQNKDRKVDETERRAAGLDEQFAAELDAAVAVATPPWIVEAFGGEPTDEQLDEYLAALADEDVSYSDISKVIQTPFNVGVLLDVADQRNEAGGASSRWATTASRSRRAPSRLPSPRGCRSAMSADSWHEPSAWASLTPM